MTKSVPIFSPRLTIPNDQHALRGVAGAAVYVVRTDEKPGECEDDQQESGREA
jgi:hypothetical protein